MTKEKYEEYIKNTYESVLKRIVGYHEVDYVLESVSNYITICIETCKGIYVNKDIDFQSYMELNECIQNNIKEVCRIAMMKNSQN